MVGGELGFGDTIIENAGSDVLVMPSLTLMTILPCVAAAVGVPLNRPVAVLNVAHAGEFAIANVSELPSASEAVGWNAYAVPTVAVVVGAPEMVGGELGFGETVIENTGSDVLVMPSLTLMTIFPCVAATVGVPLNRPVAVLNVAQAGEFVIANVSELPSASEAVG
jgi:hypothetical protein